MRILFVAMSNSIHTARWISQIADQGWDTHLFPSYDVGTSRIGMPHVTIHHPSSKYSALKQKILAKINPHYRAGRLARLIQEIKPDIIHSLEFQGAGYLTHDAKQQLKGSFPPWIVTSWGSDLYYFGGFPQHEAKIRRVLEQCNYYLPESDRDTHLAKKFGFKNTVLPKLQAAGGFDLDVIKKLSSKKLPSARKLIILKGYHGWAGRAIVGLEALKLCVDVLKGYQIVMYSTQLKSRIAAKRFSRRTGIPITIIPAGTKHEEILKLQGQARVSIGLSITDGVPYGMLEAMVMGSFPIQSFTSCADEWLEDGKSGLLVPPEDPKKVAVAIRKALSNDQLVDDAAVINAQTVRDRLDQRTIKPQVVAVYKSIKKA